MKKKYFIVFIMFLLVRGVFCTELTQKNIDTIFKADTFDSIIKELEKLGFTEIKEETQNLIDSYYLSTRVSSSISFYKTNDSYCCGSFSYFLMTPSSPNPEPPYSLLSFEIMLLTKNKNILDTFISYATNNNFIVESMEKDYSVYENTEMRASILVSEKNEEYLIGFSKEIF